jgi:hypothetical protein
MILETFGRRGGSVRDRPQHAVGGVARSETGHSMRSAGWLGQRPATACLNPGVCSLGTHLGVPQQGVDRIGGWPGS